jgi:hypothetical protein
MAGVTGVAQIDQAVTKFLAQSRFTLQERVGVVRKTIEVETLPENSGPSYNLPKYSQVTTYALTDGVDMAQAQQITDTQMTITPTEYGAQVVLTDLMMMEVRDKFMQTATQILRDSFDRQQDQTLCDDMDNYSIALGTAGTALTLGHVMAATAAISDAGRAADGTAGRGGEVAPAPYYGVFSPPQIHSLNKTLVGQVAGAVVLSSGGTAAMANTPETENAIGFGGSFTIPGIGITIVSDTNFLKDSSDDIKGGVYSKMAQILVELGSAPSSETQRDASLRATEVNFVGRWARGEYNDAWGREMLFDSVRPSS